jgi:nucleoside phosphorylase
MFGADSPSGLLILTAIPEERAAISRALADAGLSTRVVATGDGGPRAARGAREAIAAVRPNAVIGAGVGGALSPGMAPGEIVASSRVLDAAEQAPDPDPDLLRRALAQPGVTAGTLLTVVRPALTAARKAALLSHVEAAARAAPHGVEVTAGSPAGTACVDMESASWARACAAAGVPYVILRAISDTAEEDLPGYLALCMDSEGSIRRPAVARSAVLHPGSIPALLRMRRRVADCGRALGAAVAALASSLPRA